MTAIFSLDKGRNKALEARTGFGQSKKCILSTEDNINNENEEQESHDLPTDNNDILNRAPILTAINNNINRMIFLIQFH